MRMSRLFGQTLRQAPAEAELRSHQLLLRAGFMRQLGAGIFSYLPLGRRALTKIETILRREMSGIGGQELTMPVVHPAEVWKETGRWYEIGSEMGRMTDSSGRDMVLAMTHEEVVTDLVRREIHSYRQLPALIYHIQTKWRDEPRSRGGLIRAREFTMKDSYSLDADSDGLDEQYWAHYEAYFKMFGRCGLPTIAVESDPGMMGGQQAHEFMYLTPVGEDTLILCDGCGYAANRQVAVFAKPEPSTQAPLPLEKVATPGMKTIQDVAEFLNVEASQTAKAVFFVATVTGAEASEGNCGESQGRSAAGREAGGDVADTGSWRKNDCERFVFAVVRGDMDLAETKLAVAVGAKSLRPAEEGEIRAIGASPGYGSPIGIADDVIVVVDDLVAESPNLVSGANEDGCHFLNVNYGRDYQAAIVTDIAAAADGHRCARCAGVLRSVRGVEVGNIFKLGTRYSEAMHAVFTDEDGAQRPVVMGSYGIGVGRLLACVAEEHNDEFGLIWPITVAPYQVHMVALKGGFEVAEQLYAELRLVGIEVLYDDRQLAPGVKFNDADLIGVPLRLTVGGRSLSRGGVEVKRRGRDESELVAVSDATRRMRTEIDALESEIEHGLETLLRSRPSGGVAEGEDSA